MRVCPLCSSEKSSPFMSPTAWNNRHGVELRRCLSCSFVLSAEADYTYEEIGQECSAMQETAIRRALQQQRIPALCNELIQKTKLCTGDSVLDFGCGIGLSALCMQERGFAVRGVEVSQVYLQKHQELGLVTAESIQQLAQAREGFDLVLLKDVLEHIPEPLPLLQEVLTCVKPGKYLYIRVPNRFHYPFHWSIDTKTHVNHFAPKDLDRILRENGLKKIDFINVYDVSSRAGKLYHALMWPVRSHIPLYHQISSLYQKV